MPLYGFPHHARTLGQLAAPTITNIAIVGTDLVIDYTPVDGAARYEIWSAATLGSPSLLLGATNDVTFRKTLNLGPNSEMVINGGFESGDLSGWTVKTSLCAYALSTADKHAGAYSLKFTHAGNGYGYADTPFFPVVAGNTYTLTAWYKVASGTGGGMVSLDAIHKAPGGSLSGDSVDADVITTTTGWTKLTGTFTMPVGETLLSIEVSSTINSANMVVYVDDVSLVGATGVDLASFYAVRAVSGEGNTSPFSSWLLAPMQSAKLGSTSIEYDPMNGRIQSTNFVAGTTGFRADANGIDGNVGGMGAPVGLYRLGDIVLSSPGAIDFQNIPATFKHLKLVVYVRSTRNDINDALGLRFNGDANGNYNKLIAATYSTNTIVYAETDGANYGSAGYIPGNSASISPYAFGAGEVWIPNYANLVGYKFLIADTIEAQGANAITLIRNHDAAVWKSAAAVARITLMTVSNSNFATGSRATLYGMT